MLSSVVCPLTMREAPRALSNLRLWDRDFPPVTDSPPATTPPPTLIFSFNGARDDQIEQQFAALFETLPVVKRSFGKLEINFCNLPPEKDVYVRDGQTQYAPHGRKAGPNWLFYETLAAIRGNSGTIFLMETDCQPIVPNWLRRLQRVSLQHDDAWIVGSHYCGVSPLHWSVARHINGNALYNLGDPSFWRFLSEDFWPWLVEYAASHAPGLAYDCGWETLLNRIEMEYSENYDWIGVRDVLHRFRLSTFIVNIGGAAEQCGDYMWTRADILKRFPNAVLVHGPLANDNAHRRGDMALGRASLSGRTEVRAQQIQVECASTGNAFSRSMWLVGAALDPADEIVISYVLDCSAEAGVILSVTDPTGRVIGSSRRLGATEGEPRAGRSTVTLPRRVPYVKMRFVFGGPSGAPIKVGDVKVKICRKGQRLALASRVLQD